METLTALVIGACLGIIIFVVLLIPGKTGCTLMDHIHEGIDRISKYLPW